MNTELLKTFDEVEQLLECNVSLIEIAYEYCNNDPEEMIHIVKLLEIIRKNQLELCYLFDEKHTKLLNNIITNNIIEEL